MSSLEELLGEFHSDLKRAEHLLNLIKEFRAFAGSVTSPAKQGEGNHIWPEAIKLAEVAPLVRTDLPVLSGSILLYICGRFEYFVREVVVLIADEMASKASRYGDLPEKLRENLKNKTLEISQNPGRFGYSPAGAEQLIISLAQNLQPNGSPSAVTISSRVLTITESNMNPRTLTDMLRRVDIKEAWVELGKQARLKSHLSKSTDKECSAEAQARLERMMKERNGVAHPTAETSFPDPDQVLEACMFLTVLSHVIVDITYIPH